MKGFLAKTNSWHWLAVALVVCGAVSAYLWNRQVEAVRAERDPALARMAAHLESLRALPPEGPKTLEAQTAALKTRLEALRKEVADAGFAPIPKGADSTLTIKNTVDRAMAARNLRVLSADFVAAQPVARGNSAKSTVRPSAQPVSAEAYAREVQRAAAKMPENMRADFLRDAQRKIAQLKAAEARAAKRASKKPAATAAKAKAAPVRLPFKTEEMEYAVAGNFRDIFLFFVGETFKKPPYHFKDIAVTRSDTGTLRLSFTLQANYQ